MASILLFSYYYFIECCYKKVEKETKEIQDKIQEKLGNSPIEKDVIVLYEGENAPNMVRILI